MGPRPFRQTTAEGRLGRLRHAKARRIDETDNAGAIGIGEILDEPGNERDLLGDEGVM